MKFALFSATLLATGIASAAVPVNGWYSSVFGGYTYLPGNVSTTRFGVLFSDSSYKDGYNAGARIGYQSNPIRYELEYTYIHASTKNFEANDIPQIGVSGNSSANLGMANIYYDFQDVIIPAVSPFLGIGIGYAYVQTSLNSTDPFGGVFFKHNQSSFAYQGTAGLTFNFAENFALNAAYRYAATSTSNQFGKIFQAHMTNAAIIYRFDTCDYK
ncbi:MAG: porin family protein [Legionella longbeachae]|nr:porin family protein [Legionella longbeachae]